MCICITMDPSNQKIHLLNETKSAIPQIPALEELSVYADENVGWCDDGKLVSLPRLQDTAAIISKTCPKLRHMQLEIRNAGAWKLRLNSSSEVWGGTPTCGVGDNDGHAER
ncbi:hypothetical protein FRB95_004226 [Tulasnella sp. JGI-2019a]|nr:hypothetical protein FRB95_004226 [Tulasnella sp. JGI-2019a]